MKIGFNEATAMGCSTLEEDLKICEEVGFDVIEIREDMLQRYLEKNSIHELKTFFRKSHLIPGSMNAVYTYKELFSSKDNCQREKIFLKKFHSICRLSYEIGIDRIIVVPPMLQGDYQQEYPYGEEETRQDCLRIYNNLADISEIYGINLCLELVGAKKSSVRTIDFAIDIVKRINRASVGILFDACNIYMNGKIADFSAMKHIELNKIFDVHINDYLDVPEEKLAPDKRCFCGKGVVNLENYISVLRDIKYDGDLCIETFQPEYWKKSPREVIKEAYITTLEMINKV